MARDPLQAITDAETKIAARMELRGSAPADEKRKVLAVEQVADELTRIRAELKTLRGLFATYSVVSRTRP